MFNICFLSPLITDQSPSVPTKDQHKATDALLCEVVKRLGAELEGGSIQCKLQETELEVKTDLH